MLDAPRLRAGADDVVADVGVEADGGSAARSDSIDGDQELGDRDRTEIVDQPPQLRAERASVERQLVRQIVSLCSTSSARLTPWLRPRPDAVGRRESLDSSSLFGDAPRPSPTAAKRVGELAEPRVELLCLTLQPETRRSPVRAASEMARSVSGHRELGTV